MGLCGLALAIQPGYYSEENLFGMFACYFDSSKQGNEQVLSVAGFISSVHLWNSVFDPAWRSYLRQNGLDGFHMKDFAHSRKGYERFRGNNALRDEFMAGALHIIKQTVQYGIGRVIPKREFDIANQTYKLKESGVNRFCLAGLECMFAARRLARRREQIEFVFHEGDKGFGKLRELAHRNDLPTPIDRPDKDRRGVRGFVQIQAADLVAYELARENLDNDGSAYRSWRKSFQSLARIDNTWEVLRARDLKDFCVREGIPARSRLA